MNTHRNLIQLRSRTIQSNDQSSKSNDSKTLNGKSLLKRASQSPHEHPINKTNIVKLNTSLQSNRELPIAKSDVAKLNMSLPSNRDQMNAKNVTDFTTEVQKAMVEINNLRVSFYDFQKTVGQSIESMRETIDNKGQVFITVTRILKQEIDKINGSIKLNDSLERNMWQLPMATRFTNIIRGGAIMLEIQYNAQLEKLQNKVTEIEQSNKYTEEMVNDLVTSIATFMDNGRPVNTTMQHGELEDKIGDFENTIECMQHEIDRIKTASHIDDEKMIK